MLPPLPLLVLVLSLLLLYP